jgi:predicted site-specific integrase-resolvase
MNNVKEKIGTAVAAKMLGINRSTLLGWIANGRCPIAFYRHHISGVYVFDVADVDAYLDAIRIEPMEAHMA